MQPGEDHDIALPRPSYEGLYGTIYCSRCEFFGLGYNHPEWCTWEWLKETDAPLLIWGELDARSPLGVAHQFEEAIPDTKLVVIPAAATSPVETRFRGQVYQNGALHVAIGDGTDR